VVRTWGGLRQDHNPVKKKSLPRACRISRLGTGRFPELKVNGFKVTPHGVVQGVLMPPPKGPHLKSRGDELEFIVGSAN